jgi:acetylornithine/succinyldiaminopimelate/putrescine aminotransferase/predicted amino acid dehydrogenase/long-subunit acyl-CoA synthetase (AMP-forming)
MFDKLIHSSEKEINFQPLTIRDIIFNELPHRKEECEVIYGHIGESLVTISLESLRHITRLISRKLLLHGLKRGDTIFLASFSSSNELANSIIFTSAMCLGVRVFVPIFPEPAEFDNWIIQTGFTCVILPFQELLNEKGHDREKEVIYSLQLKCRQHGIPFFDANNDFGIYDMLLNQDYISDRTTSTNEIFPEIDPKSEAVIFTTSGTSGMSKLVVYTHEGFSNCCQSWQQRGLFTAQLFGNPGFSPLFTHTIGIRTFINSIWSGNPFCILVTDWFLHKPEVIRYLLMKMNLGHIIGGPAFFNTLLELFRQFPELKTSIQQTLQAAISIGAPYDEGTAAKFRSATGISMMNGFGTTETLMISLNKPALNEEMNPGSMGKLMPGVTLGLTATDDPAIFEMYIHSSFQSAFTIGENITSEFFDTGDLVYYDEKSGEVYFYGRRTQDFIKDEYGVKIPLNALKDYYKALYDRAAWIEWIPMVNIPGLAALIFLPHTEKSNCLKELAALAKTINENLKRELEPFEYAHRHIERLAISYDEVPLTRKGTVSKDQISKRFGQIIAELRNPFVFNQNIENAETGDKSNLHKFSNPYMSELLESLKMDKVYIRGEGDYLFFKNGEREQKVTDLVGGFGAGLMGHNHPRIKEAILRFIESGYPALNNQGSQYYYPGLLARELNRLFSQSTGKYFKVLFANSGTEATELALHHAYYEWRMKIEKLRDEQLQLYGANPGLDISGIWDQNMQLVETATPSVLVSDNCFHGYTSAARSLLNSKKQRNLFSGLLKIQPLHLSANGKEWHSQATQFISKNNLRLKYVKVVNGRYIKEFVDQSTIIASIIEPVRGEGGIYETGKEMARFLAVQDFPLISDEIQCGLGRTGRFPAYDGASYYLLGKSLGGGIQKIAAVLIDDRRFKPLFHKYFSSTFANGELAACTGLTTLQLIEDEKLVEVAAKKGEKYIVQLREIGQRYPDIIESVNGAGLMIGIHFNPGMGEQNNILRILIENEKLGYLISGWLLNEHYIRMLPSLSKPNSLRLEPSFYINDAEIDYFCKVLDELCLLLRDKKIYDLLRFIMNGDPYTDRVYPQFEGLFPQQIEAPLPGAVITGFIGNFTLSHRELQVIEPDLLKASDTGLRILFGKLSGLLEGKPLKILSKNLLNGRVHFTFYILPFDTAQMEVVSRWGKRRYFISKIQEAVDKLSNEGATCISLGAHTSIITGNGLNLAERNGCRILTGNSLTVASCLWHLDWYLRKFESDHLRPQVIAIVGASGNIGSGLVDCLNDPKYDAYNLVLLGNNERRLKQLKEMHSGRKSEVIFTGDIFEIRKADVIICCVNTNDPIIFPHHISTSRQVFIIDMSVPYAVAEDVKNMANIVFCYQASSVFLQGTPGLLISSHTPVSKIFCCAGESILTALYNLQLPMKGHIDRNSVEALIPFAEQEGFFNSCDYEFSV